MEYKFKLFNQELNFSESQKKYFDLRGLFFQKGIKCASEFQEIYSSYTNIEDLVKKGFQDGWNLIYREITEASDKLIELGDFSSTPDSFYQEHFKKYSDYESQFDLFADEYMQINLDAEKLTEYRRARKNNRSELIGGGFGIEGAAKGIAIASAANLTYGVAHGIFNFFGNAITESKKKQKLAELLNTHTLKHFQSAISQDIFRIHIALFDAMSKQKICNIDEIMSADDIKKSNSIFSNIKNGKISSEENSKSAIVQAIRLFPVDEKIFNHVMENYPESQDEIEKIASFCSVDLSGYKMQILKSYYSDTDTSSEESVKETIEKIKNRAIELNIDEYNEVLQIGESQLKELDLMARTYEDEVYDTREESKLALNEHAEIKKLYLDLGIGGLTESDTIPICEEIIENACLDALKSLKSKKFTYRGSDLLIVKLDNFLQKIDLELRTLDKYIYETRAIASKAAKEKDKIVKGFKKLGLKLGSKNEVSFSSEIKEFDVSKLRDDIKNNFHAYTGIESSLKQLDQILVNLRTFDDDVYESQHIAQQAAKEVLVMQEFLEKIDSENEDEVRKTIDFAKGNLHAYKNKEQILEALLGELEQLELLARTVSGIVYDTKEEALAAAEELKHLQSKADEIIKDYMSDKSCSFYVKGSIPERKILAFSQKAKSLFRKNIHPEEIYAYIDDTILGGGDEGIGINHNYLIITKGGRKGTFLLSEISEIEGPSIFSESISFLYNGINIKYVGTQGRKGLEKFCELIERFTKFQTKNKATNIQESFEHKTNEGATDIENEALSKYIVENFETDESQKLYIKPYFNTKKISNFVRECRSKYEIDLEIDDVYAYFDETLFGSGDKGVAITSDKVIVNIDNIGVIPIAEIDDAEESGLLNKKISILLKSGQEIYFVLTQGNKGAIAIKDIIKYNGC